MNSQILMKLCAVFGLLIIGVIADVSHLGKHLPRNFATLMLTFRDSPADG